MRYLREVLADGLTRAFGTILVLIIVLVILNTFSNFHETNPQLGTFFLSLSLILFLAGGVVYALAVLREFK